MNKKFKYFYFILPFLTVGLIFFSPLSLLANNLERLDQIVTKARNLDDFLDNSRLVEEYKLALVQYYGDRITHERFSFILNQLKKLNSEIPGFGSRMWESLDLQLSFESDENTSKPYVKIKPGQEHSRIDFSSLYKQITKIDWNHASLNQIGPLNNLLLLHNRNTQGLSRREKEKLDKEFYLEVKSKYGNLAIIFFEEPLKIIFDSINISTIKEEGIANFLEQYQNWRTLFKNYIDKRSKNSDEVNNIKNLLMTIMSDKMPSLESILTVYQDQFTVDNTKKPKILYSVIPRRIHGIWKGIPLNECVANGDVNTTPERWATIALKDSLLYNVETQDHGYLGFVQIVPILGPDNKIYSSIDYGATYLRYEISLINQEGNRILIPRFELFNAQFAHLQKKNKNWGGIVLSNSKNINNAKVKEEILKSTKYKHISSYSRNLFKHIDPMVNSIVTVSNKIRYPMRPTNYSNGQMVFDAFDSGAKALTIYPIENIQLSHNPIKTQAPLIEPERAAEEPVRVQHYPYVANLILQTDLVAVDHAQNEFLIHAERDGITGAEWNLINQFFAGEFQERLNLIFENRDRYVLDTTSLAFALLEILNSNRITMAPESLANQVIQSVERLLTLDRYHRFRRQYLEMIENVRNKFIRGHGQGLQCRLLF
jgi:hypothetical protein